MTGQMCWRSQSDSSPDLILHIRLDPHQPWKPYTHFPGIKAPDFRIPEGSKGWATCQKLLKAGWTLIPTETTRRSVIDDSWVA